MSVELPRSAVRTVPDTQGVVTKHDRLTVDGNFRQIVVPGEFLFQLASLFVMISRHGEDLLTSNPATVFENPDSFDIERYPNNHLAFGFGTHFCLGNQLARLELSIMQTRLLQRLPDMRLASDAELPLRPANFVSGLEKMPVTFTPTAPLG